MVFRFLLVFFLFSFTAFSLEDILEENQDVIDYCLIDHFDLDKSHKRVAELFETCTTRVTASTSKRELRDVLLSRYMNHDFIRMILQAYQSRSLSESRLLLSYLVADRNGYDDFKASFGSRLISYKSLIRHSNDVPHFHSISKRISFVKETLEFKYKGHEYTLKVEPNSKYNISSIKTSGYFDLLSHALRGLMQIGTFTPVDISLTRKDSNSYAYLDPNYLLYKLHSMTATENKNMVMLGDVNSQGEYLRYGYLRSSLDGLSMDEKYVLVSSEAKKQILEVVKVEGIKTLTEKIFIAPKDIKDAFKILQSPDQYYDLANTFSILASSIKYKSKWPAVIRGLDNILAKNPRFLSAEVLKDVLTGKVMNRLSFASSFREFNKFFRYLDLEDGSSPELVSEIKAEIAKVSKVIHPEFKSLVKLCDEIAEDRLVFFKTPKPKAQKKGTQLSRGGNTYRTVSQRLYRKIREARLKRDILLDKQKVLETIFDR